VSRIKCVGRVSYTMSNVSRGAETALHTLGVLAMRLHLFTEVVTGLFTGRSTLRVYQAIVALHSYQIQEHITLAVPQIANFETFDAKGNLELDELKTYLLV